MLFYLFNMCILICIFQIKVISLLHTSRCEITDENGLASRSYHQRCACRFLIWYALQSINFETLTVDIWYKIEHCPVQPSIILS
jgi:hypothetical protein